MGKYTFSGTAKLKNRAGQLVRKAIVEVTIDEQKFIDKYGQNCMVTDRGFAVHGDGAVTYRNVRDLPLIEEKNQ